MIPIRKKTATIQKITGKILTVTLIFRIHRQDCDSGNITSSDSHDGQNSDDDIISHPSKSAAQALSGGNITSNDSDYSKTVVGDIDSHFSNETFPALFVNSQGATIGNTIRSWTKDEEMYLANNLSRKPDKRKTTDRDNDSYNNSGPTRVRNSTKR